MQYSVYCAFHNLQHENSKYNAVSNLHIEQNCNILLLYKAIQGGMRQLIKWTENGPDLKSPLADSHAAVRKTAHPTAIHLNPLLLILLSHKHLNVWRVHPSRN